MTFLCLHVVCVVLCVLCSVPNSIVLLDCVVLCCVLSWPLCVFGSAGGRWPVAVVPSMLMFFCVLFCWGVVCVFFVFVFVGRCVLGHWCGVVLFLFVALCIFYAHVFLCVVLLGCGVCFLFVFVFVGWCVLGHWWRGLRAVSFCCLLLYLFAVCLLHVCVCCVEVLFVFCMKRGGASAGGVCANCFMFFMFFLFFLL